MASRALRVVVVDDHADCGVSLAMLLRKLGHHASVCLSARQALEELETVRPDALLLDLGMPDINGFELAVLVRERYPEVTLLAVTGFVDARNRQLAQGAGFDFFIPKPVDFGLLIQTLNDLPAALPSSL